MIRLRKTTKERKLTIAETQTPSEEGPFRDLFVEK
jgi:hypothetical protein